MKLFPISSAGIERRWLMPAYRFGNSPMAWQCAACGKLFSISAAEAQSATQLPPLYIEREFRLHSCELHLCERFSNLDVYRVEKWPEEGQYEMRTTAYGRIRR
jgi:hypothetical protein